MNQIVKFLFVINVVVGLEVSSKKCLFEQVGLLFENNYGIVCNVVYDVFFVCEKLGFIGLGQGIVILYGCIKGLKEVVGVCMCFDSLVQFDLFDGKLVNFVFVLFVFEVVIECYFQFLFEFVQMFFD